MENKFGPGPSLEFLVSTCVAFLLGGIALSGKFSVSASGVLIWMTFALALFAFLRLLLHFDWGHVRLTVSLVVVATVLLVPTWKIVHWIDVKEPVQTTPSIEWNTPPAIESGTPLSDEQLNATASVPGLFTYNPAKGATLPPGTNTLIATFYPKDRSRYREVTVSVLMKVNAPTITPPAAQPTAIIGQRTLEDWRSVRMIATLSRFPGQKIVLVASAGEETHRYALQFRKMLQASHWDVRGPLKAPIDQEFSDLQVSISPETQRIPTSIQILRGVLDDAQLKVRQKFVFDPDVQSGIVALLIGGKSPENVSTERYPPVAVEQLITESLFLSHQKAQAKAAIASKPRKKQRVMSRLR